MNGNLKSYVWLYDQLQLKISMHYICAKGKLEQFKFLLLVFLYGYLVESNIVLPKVKLLRPWKHLKTYEIDWS